MRFWPSLSLPAESLAWALAIVSSERWLISLRAASQASPSVSRTMKWRRMP